MIVLEPRQEQAALADEHQVLLAVEVLEVVDARVDVADVLRRLGTLPGVFVERRVHDVRGVAIERVVRRRLAPGEQIGTLQRIDIASPVGRNHGGVGRRARRQAPCGGRSRPLKDLVDLGLDSLFGAPFVP